MEEKALSILNSLNESGLGPFTMVKTKAIKTRPAGWVFKKAGKFFLTEILFLTEKLDAGNVRFTYAKTIAEIIKNLGLSTKLETHL